MERMNKTDVGELAAFGGMGSLAAPDLLGSLAASQNQPALRFEEGGPDALPDVEWWKYDKKDDPNGDDESEDGSDTTVDPINTQNLLLQAAAANLVPYKKENFKKDLADEALESWLEDHPEDVRYPDNVKSTQSMTDRARPAP